MEISNLKPLLPDKYVFKNKATSFKALLPPFGRGRERKKIHTKPSIV